MTKNTFLRKAGLLHYSMMIVKKERVDALAKLEKAAIKSGSSLKYRIKAFKAKRSPIASSRELGGGRYSPIYRWLCKADPASLTRRGCGRDYKHLIKIAQRGHTVHPSKRKGAVADGKPAAPCERELPTARTYMRDPLATFRYIVATFLHKVSGNEPLEADILMADFALVHQNVKFVTAFQATAYSPKDSVAFTVRFFWRTF